MSSRSNGVTNVEFSRCRIVRVSSSPSRSDAMTTSILAGRLSMSASSACNARAQRATLVADWLNSSKNLSSVGTSRKRMAGAR